MFLAVALGAVDDVVFGAVDDVLLVTVDDGVLGSVVCVLEFLLPLLVVCLLFCCC